MPRPSKLPVASCQLSVVSSAGHSQLTTGKWQLATDPIIPHRHMSPGVGRGRRRIGRAHVEPDCIPRRTIRLDREKRMHSDFYLPEDPEYTIFDSARDSVRFAHYCLEPTEHGRWRPVSSFVD